MADFFKGETCYLAIIYYKGNQKIDPSSVELKIQKPNGEIIEPIIKREDTGVYSSYFNLDEIGCWKAYIYAKDIADNVQIDKDDIWVIKNDVES